MAKTQQERDQDAIKKREALGEIELRHRVVDGTRHALKELMGWHGIKEIAEAVQLLVINNHALGAGQAPGQPPSRRVPKEDLRHRMRPGGLAMLADLQEWRGIGEPAALVELLIIEAYALGPEGSAPFLSIPRHEYTPSKNVARQLHALGIRQARREDEKEAEDEWRE
ncbi:hypothetical protein NNO07_18830 [Pseudomonas resinovorans]|uniref:Uncharacterized protein n=1 Tax=Metapseudomonas resinovorans TaxID=53412 RepID=A0ABT4Y8N1_METRE|nr:hypothetical protein [Pseudomonas resinovorans]MDA8485126.1 hypothetical protein [Pseudomonas resinovorans]